MKQFQTPRREKVVCGWIHHAGWVINILSDDDYDELPIKD